MQSETVTSSWANFVAACAQAYEDGVDERQFGSGLVGKFVRWGGLVYQLKVHGDEIVPGVRIEMPMTRIPISHGWHFEGSFLFLYLDSPATREKAKTLRKGQGILFGGAFRDQVVFPNVRFSPDEEQQTVFLSMGLAAGVIY